MRNFGGSRKFSAIVLVTAITMMLLSVSLALGSSEESGGGGVTVIPDWTVAIQLANFLLILWILNRLLYRPIRNILRQRKEKIDGLELSIQTYNEDAQEKDEAFAVGIKDARTKGLAEKEALLQAAAEEEKKVIAKVNEKAQAELADIRQKISQEAQSAKAALQTKVEEFAGDICQKILGRTVQ
ncbi:MAG: ATP synthase F0 subunit B [Desulfobacterales bacterium]|jgi:F-type H+-transporting ATPase subunit b